MRLAAVYFSGKLTRQHTRLAAVLARSAAVHSPATPLEVHAIAGVDEDLRAVVRGRVHRQWLDNARKAKHHCRLIEAAADGEVLGMLDTDTMICRDLSELAAVEFDFAYTVRPAGGPWKLNTGVYFVRVSQATRVFVRSWYATVQAMLADAKFHRYWKQERRYGGIHQAALGCLLETDPLLPRCLPLPCEEWNCVSGTWATAPAPRIVHVMGRLRDWCLKDKPAPTDRERQLVEQWKAFETSVPG